MKYDKLFLPRYNKLDRFHDLLYSSINRRCLRLVLFHYKNGDRRRAGDWLRRLRRITGVPLTMGQALRLAYYIPEFLENEKHKI